MTRLRSLGRFAAAAAVNLAAIALIVFGGGLGNIQRVLAGSNGYSETWTATQFRNFGSARYCDTYWGFCNDEHAMSLGPAKWSVSGVNGAVSWTETWSVNDADWSDTHAPADYLVGFFTGAYTAPPAYGATTGFNNPWDYYSSDYFNSGLYGVVKSVTKNNFPYSAKQIPVGYASWPKKWTVTGTITTP